MQTDCTRDESIYDRLTTKRGGFEFEARQYFFL